MWGGKRQDYSAKIYHFNMSLAQETKHMKVLSLQSVCMKKISQINYCTNIQLTGLLILLVMEKYFQLESNLDYTTANIKEY